VFSPDKNKSLHIVKMPFKADLEMGEHYQRKVLELIEYDDCGMSKGCYKPYDLWIVYDGERTTIEVKADRMTQRTGNMVIEYECNGTSSGITSSTADYWVYFIHNTGIYFIIPSSEIRRLIAEKVYTRIIKGGDGLRSSMYVFPMSVFDEWKDTYVVVPVHK